MAVHYLLRQNIKFISILMCFKMKYFDHTCKKCAYSGFNVSHSNTKRIDVIEEQIGLTLRRHHLSTAFQINFSDVIRLLQNAQLRISIACHCLSLLVLETISISTDWLVSSIRASTRYHFHHHLLHKI